MIPDIKHKVEEIGIFYESTGLTRMEARVFALLLLADPPEQDFFAIQEFLSASKSSISNALKRLMNEGRVEYVTKPGDRRRYFRVSSQKWLAQIQKTFAEMTPFVGAIDQVLELRKDMDSEDFNRDLTQIRDYFLYLEKELTRIVAKWDRRQKALEAERG